MKLTKTVKYNYQLTEENLEKDINSFISRARRGDFSWDHKYENEGLKIIKQYFKILKEKFDKQEYEECKDYYEKLILFCIDASGANDSENLFDYEDLLARISKDFDSYIKNYFICLVKTCDIGELAERVSSYAKKLDIYSFESDKNILLEYLNNGQINELEEKMLAKTQGMSKKDEDKQEILYFLLYLAEARKDKNKYLLLCNRFKVILNEKELECLKEEYEEND